MKKALLCILLVAVMLFLAACQNPLVYMRKPCNQPNTVWQSEDGRITFTVGNKYDWSATGSIQLDGENVEFYLTCTTGSGIVLYPLEKATGIFYAEDQLRLQKQKQVCCHRPGNHVLPTRRADRILPGRTVKPAAKMQSLPALENAQEGGLFYCTIK